MQIAAPAKINLTLEVLDRRDDGYHTLRSVMVPLELCDTIEITDAPTFSFTCSDPSLQNDDNLIVRAVKTVAPSAKRAVHLQKVIPTQAGLGGGSSDAAAVLLAAMQGAFGPVEHRDWVATARELGSDVPFFLAQSGALVEGTGERVTALGPLPPWHVLVVKPPVAVSTAAAYAQLDAHREPQTRPRNSSVSLKMVDVLQRGDFAHIWEPLSNDFLAPVASMNPEIVETIKAVLRVGAQAILCGSGSALFALAQSAEEIAAIDEHLELPETFLRFRTRFRNSDAWRR